MLLQLIFFSLRYIDRLFNLMVTRVLGRMSLISLLLEDFCNSFGRICVYVWPISLSCIVVSRPILGILSHKLSLPRSWVIFLLTSLTISLYKLLSKVLMTRLSQVMVNIISQNQKTFHKGRLLVHGVAAVN